MALAIETFSNEKGGNAFFKAIGHPLAQRKAADLLARLRQGPVALYDPLGFAAALNEIYDLSDLEIESYYVQDIGEIGKSFLGSEAQPITDLPQGRATTLMVAAFDAEALIAQIRQLLAQDTEVISLDALRLPDDMLADTRRYLNGLNFATNLVFFREENGHHTRLVTANYWSGYGAKAPELYCCLFDAQGAVLAEWRDPLPQTAGSLVLDSLEIRQRFNLGDFTGQVYFHVLKASGHDVVKYALDTYGDEPQVLSCTHDANAWPAERYAGLPAPAEGEAVTLWLQNSHPRPIPPGGLGLNVMGSEDVAWLDQEIPPYGLFGLDTASLLPGARWPQQIEVRAGKYVVRPRYEVTASDGRSRIAHVNVERTDLRPDPKLPELSNLLGKGYVLPAPILPRTRFRTLVLPTPMATCQDNLPTALLAFDPEGRQVARRGLGRLPRDHTVAVELDELLADSDIDWGHFELVYDFAEGGEGDGWLHGLFRYQDKRSGHCAENSFGAHVFNAVLTYRGEPQSYAGRPPGLSTRLYLRLSPAPYQALCHLIYPASTPWHETSCTELLLHDGEGRQVASRTVSIPCGGSLLWRPAEFFSAEEMTAATGNGYVLIRDRTCRLFGYHGLTHGEEAFSFDHMFGF